MLALQNVGVAYSMAGQTANAVPAAPVVGNGIHALMLAAGGYFFGPRGGEEIDQAPIVPVAPRLRQGTLPYNPPRRKDPKRRAFKREPPTYTEAGYRLRGRALSYRQYSSRYIKRAKRL